MASKGSVNVPVCGEWWKHLRPYNKRRAARLERRHSKKDIQKEIDDLPSGVISGRP